MSIHPSYDPKGKVWFTDHHQAKSLRELALYYPGVEIEDYFPDGYGAYPMGPATRNHSLRHDGRTSVRPTQFKTFHRFGDRRTLEVGADTEVPPKQRRRSPTRQLPLPVMVPPQPLQPRGARTAVARAARAARPERKYKVLGLLEQGLCPAEIGQRTGLSVHTISNIVRNARKFEVEHELSPLPRSAAHPGWTAERDTILERLMKECYSASQIAAYLGYVTRCAVIGRYRRIREKQVREAILPN